jgi:hypothetical protein
MAKQTGQQKQKPVNAWNVVHDGRTVRLSLYVNRDRMRIECPSLDLSWEGTDLAQYPGSLPSGRPGSDWQRSGFPTSWSR